MIAMDIVEVEKQKWCYLFVYWKENFMKNFSS